MPNKDFELRWVIALLFRWYWLIVLMAILAVAAAFIVTNQMPPVYKASATLLISPAQNNSSSQYTDLMASERLALTYSQLLTDRTVLAAVKQQLGMKQSTEELEQHIEASPIRDTQLIKLTVSDSDADQAALIANSVALAFKARVESLSSERYTITIMNAQNRVNELQSRVDDLEVRVEALRKSKVEKDLLLANKQAALDTLWNEYQTQQSNQQQIELAIAEATGNVYIFEPVQVNTTQGRTQASAVISVVPVHSNSGLESTDSVALTYGDLIITTPMLEGIITDLNLSETAGQLALQISVTPVNGTQLIRLSVADSDVAKAKMISNALVNAFISQAKKLLAEPYVDRLVSIQSQIKSTGGSIDEVQNNIGTLTGEISQIEFDINRQETNLAENRTDLRESQKDLEELQITAAESSDNVVISESAQTPKNSSQSKLTYILLAGLVGLVIGAGVAFLLEYIDGRVRTDKDIRKEFDLPSLGSIGRFNKKIDELVLWSQPASPQADDFRVLGMHIRRYYEKEKSQTFLVTSPTPTEGKSVVVANLAVALAKTGLRVIAIDADLRRPRLHKIFNLNQEDGLANSLANGYINGCLKNTQLAELKILTSGAVPLNPTELLSLPITGNLIKELKGKADIILIDCSPVLTTADASILAPVVDAVLLVLRSGKSENQLAQTTIETLRNAKANIIGVVLNAVPERREGYSKYYREV